MRVSFPLNCLVFRAVTVQPIKDFGLVVVVLALAALAINTKAVRPSAKSGAATRASTNNTDSSRGIALEASKLKSASKTVKDIISRIGVDGMMGMT